ncbi:MAG: succinyldiaminopimelate transaminase [Prochloron sp. SP5CPC1]|nr:succinyldiaminopimelate transaminase [Candidatus Paraprochloron terpiosi SP5CPC1]
MNPRLASLPTYLWGKYLQLVFSKVHVDLSPISLHIGEPKHAPPKVIRQALVDSLSGLRHYTNVKGSQELREAIASWLQQRFKLAHVNPDRQVLPVNGTREALFGIAQCVVDSRQPNPKVLIPNPFYEAYLCGAILAGGSPVYTNCLEATDFLPDFSSVSKQDWQDCQLLYICSPSNPCGTIIPRESMEMLIRYAERYDFIIASDECYSEIYGNEDTPPTGLLEAAWAMGLEDFKRCIVFHSLSKRSNVPGLRSGFVAGDAEIIQKFEKYRSYQGYTMPSYIQAASTIAWKDEKHVVKNRQLYREKFAVMKDILSPTLPVHIPPASFYLWLKTPIPDVDFTRQLYLQKHVMVIPGSYLAYRSEGINPGEGFIRLALVPELQQCVEAAYRIKNFIETGLTQRH